jgi:hypothetical protein
MLNELKGLYTEKRDRMQAETSLRVMKRELKRL